MGSDGLYDTIIYVDIYTRNLDILTPAARAQHTLGWQTACLQIILIKFAHPCTLQRSLYIVGGKIVGR